MSDAKNIPLVPANARIMAQKCVDRVGLECRFEVKRVHRSSRTEHLVMVNGRCASCKRLGRMMFRSPMPDWNGLAEKLSQLDPLLGEL